MEWNVCNGMECMDQNVWNEIYVMECMKRNVWNGMEYKYEMNWMECMGWNMDCNVCVEWMDWIVWNGIL